MLEIELAWQANLGTATIQCTSPVDTCFAPTG
jgi:hypothetical protein